MKFFKKILPILILLHFIISCSTTQDSHVDELKTISKKHIVDSRLEVFDVKQEENSIEVRTSNADVYNEISELNKSNINITLLPEKSLDKQYGVINHSATNMRSETRYGSTLISQAILGTPIKIYDKKPGWYKIQTPDKYLGWVNDYAIQSMNEKEMKKWNQGDKIIFMEHAGFVYAEENCDGDVISDIVLGNMLKHLGTSEKFYSVQFPDGRTGHVKKSQSKTVSQWFEGIELSEESLVKMAKKFMGIPYLWGGTSVKGIDCSGFVKTVYFMHGVILQRDASQQVLYGEKVSIKDDFKHLQKGDLLFFGSNPKRITHVGMYIGDKEFIHETGPVKINSLDELADNYSGYRASSFRSAKRILGSVNTEGISTYKTNEFYK